jgi:hypothetical protein
MLYTFFSDLKTIAGSIELGHESLYKLNFDISADQCRLIIEVFVWNDMVYNYLLKYHFLGRSISLHWLHGDCSVQLGLDCGDIGVLEDIKFGVAHVNSILIFLRNLLSHGNWFTRNDLILIFFDWNKFCNLNCSILKRSLFGEDVLRSEDVFHFVLKVIIFVQNLEVTLSFNSVLFNICPELTGKFHNNFCRFLIFLLIIEDSAGIKSLNLKPLFCPLYIWVENLLAKLFASFTAENSLVWNLLALSDANQSLDDWRKV